MATSKPGMSVMDHPSGWKRQGHMRMGYVRSHPRMSYQGDRRDAAEMNRLTAAMRDARTEFREATGRFDMGAATAAELRYDGLAGELREMLGVVVLRPDGRPFTDVEAESFLAAVRSAMDEENRTAG
jgi:hypothetical protein